jgi:hypothetical protein
MGKRGAPRLDYGRNHTSVYTHALQPGARSVWHLLFAMIVMLVALRSPWNRRKAGKLPVWALIHDRKVRIIHGT